MAVDPNQVLTITLSIIRGSHSNGMSLIEYAQAVQAGTQPILSHLDYVTNFSSPVEYHDTVIDWATSNGLTVISSDTVTGTIKVSGSVSNLSQLFSVEIDEVSDESASYLTSNNSPSVPNAISAYVDRVIGFDQTPKAMRPATVQVPLDQMLKAQQVETETPTLLPNPFANPTNPLLLSIAYNFPEGDGYGGTIGIVSYTSVGSPTGYALSDLNKTFAMYGVDTPTIVNVGVNGAPISSTSDSESVLDICAAGCVVPKAKIVYYETYNNDQGTYDLYNYIINDTTNNPSVISVSWGGGGDTLTYDTEFASMVAKGITYVTGSGDWGAQNGPSPSTFGVFNNCSPDILVVGGTSIVTGSDGSILQEIAWSASGGGVGTVHPKPTRQQNLTYTTITNTGTIGTPTTFSYRAIPDVSGVADGYNGMLVYINGTANSYIGGVSYSTPVIAGLILRINVLTGIRTGNPGNTMYGTPAAFNDITYGNNVYSPGTLGYNATVGWDAVTGLGTINGPRFYGLFKTGTNYPRKNVGFRPTSGAVYPRSSRNLVTPPAGTLETVRFRNGYSLITSTSGGVTTTSTIYGYIIGNTSGPLYMNLYGGSEIIECAFTSATATNGTFSTRLFFGVRGNQLNNKWNLLTINGYKFYRSSVYGYGYNSGSNYTYWVWLDVNNPTSASGTVKVPNPFSTSQNTSITCNFT